MMHDRAEAEDVVQEAAIVAYRRRADFSQGTNFAAWIAKIVRLTALNHIKKTKRSGVTVTDPTDLDRERIPVQAGHESSSDSVSDNNSVLDNGRLSAHQTIFDDEVLSALETIGEIARACLLLHTVQRLSYDEISQTLQIPVGTAMSHVHRAKQGLRHHLNRVKNKERRALEDKHQT
jgi:RNA polymerase sigma-70 factor, ECF subfamily